MCVLNKDEIREMIFEFGLIKDYIDLEIQLQPNGFDCTLRKVFKLKNAGKIDFDNKERIVSETEEISFENDWAYLPKGYYKAQINEIVKLPRNVMAIGKPRSTLVRCGASVISAVWDAGYEGRGEIGIFVANEEGIWLKRNARIMQLVFLKLEKETEGYRGTYFKENL
ncbi:MAG: deoxyuridine 5'-triphosphate nucleotidohydrolase [Archaeoglobales archaeon]|nr:deoxyuridine 5'-triphosphate nucleotidohydrolase [Archaeoglobales archaeon]